MSKTRYLVSGIQLYYNVNKPPGKRIVKLLVRCASCPIPQYQSLDTEALYKVILPSYLARGGAGFTVIREKRVSHTAGDLDSDVVVNYLKAKSPIMTGTENRIVFDEQLRGDCVNRGYVSELSTVSMLSLCLISFLYLV